MYEYNAIAYERWLYSAYDDDSADEDEDEYDNEDFDFDDWHDNRCEEDI